MSLDLLFLAKNRFLFTQESLTQIDRGTLRGRINELVLQDDGSTDGTDAYLEHKAGAMGATFRRSCHGSAIAAMNEFINRSKADLVAKVDNDTMLPPGWLKLCLGIMDRRPELELLGLENYRERPCPEATDHSYRRADHVGGIFIARRRIFEQHPLPLADGVYYGFTDWQKAHGIIRGWIAPPIPTFLLDRLPVEPWISLTRTYESVGWQRCWRRYPLADAHLWSWCQERWQKEMIFAGQAVA